MSLQNYPSRITAISLCLLVAGLAFLAGCDSAPKTTSPGGGGVSQIHFGTPTASPDSLSQSSTTVVSITAFNSSSQPVTGVVVTFAVEPQNGGTFTPAVDTTGANGVAGTIFTPSRAGNMILYATSGAVNSPYVSVTVASTNQASSGNITLDVAPSLLTADGISSAQVTIGVADDNDNPAPESTLVKLTAGERFVDVDGNGYFSTGDTLLIDYNGNTEWDPIGFIPSVAYTHNGEVTVDYTAGTEATTAYIKATVTNGGAFNGAAETSVQLRPDAAIFAIELTTDDAGIQVRHTGGIETTNLRAICYDVNGNTVPEGIAVNFVIADGPGGGENIAGQGLGPVSAITNANGMATVPVWSGTISGTLRLYASCGTILSNATFVAVYAGPPYYIAVGAENCNIQGWNTVNTENKIAAVVSDVYHNPVQDEVVVYFTVDEGVIGAYATTKDSTGVASVIFRTSLPQDDGIVWVEAETSGGTVASSTFFYNSGLPAAIDIAMSPQTLLANGSTKATIWSDVRDVNGNFVIDGTQVKNKALYGAVGTGGTKDGCHASIFEDTYTAPVLEQDYSMTGGVDNGIGAIDVITSRSGFVGQSVVCTLLTSSSFYAKSSIALNSSTIPYNATGVPIRVIIKDRYGNPLGDHTLSANISAGTMVGGTGTQKTNTFGEAFGFLFNAPAAPPPDSTGKIPNTPALITVTDTDPLGGGLVLTTKITYSAEEKK